MYLWVQGRWYCLGTMLDACSRYIVHCALLPATRPTNTWCKAPRESNSKNSQLIR